MFFIQLIALNVSFERFVYSLHFKATYNVEDNNVEDNNVDNR